MDGEFKLGRLQSVHLHTCIGAVYADSNSNKLTFCTFSTKTMELKCFIEDEIFTHQMVSIKRLIIIEKDINNENSKEIIQSPVINL